MATEVDFFLFKPTNLFGLIDNTKKCLSNRFLLWNLNPFNNGNEYG